jgi:chromosome segregation ATPase
MTSSLGLALGLRERIAAGVGSTDIGSAGVQDQPVAALDLDEDLFSAQGPRSGGDNDAVRDLLIEAGRKIEELDAVKAAVSGLIAPVARTLRAFDVEKAEKTVLERTLEAMQAEQQTLRDQLAARDRQTEEAAAENTRLRDALATAQRNAAAQDAAKAELNGSLMAARQQAADLENRIALETAGTRRLREEAERRDARLAAADRRAVALETELSNVRQRLTIADTEKRSLHASVEKAINETGRMSRRQTEAQNLLAAAQTRLRQAETQLAELSSERAQIAAALAEANERRETDSAAQTMRFDAMKSRAATAEKLLAETREQLAARANDVRKLERQLSELALAHGTLQNRFAAAEHARNDCETRIHELEQTRAVLNERQAALTQNLAARDTALARAEDRIATLTDTLAGLHAQTDAARITLTRELDDARAALNRERAERAILEGALEAGRKDLARVMREVMALQRRQMAQEPDPTPNPANAA